MISKPEIVSSSFRFLKTMVKLNMTKIINILSKPDLKKIRDMEMALSRNFYLLCVFVTLVTMIMTVIEFFSRGMFFPAHMNLFYLGILLIYSLHKELIRWLGHRKIERQGEYFVYAWVLLTTVLYIVNFVSKDYYIHLAKGEPSTTLRDLSMLTLQVLGVFILTRCLKIVQLIIKEHQLKS